MLLHSFFVVVVLALVRSFLVFLTRLTKEEDVEVYIVVKLPWKPCLSFIFACHRNLVLLCSLSSPVHIVLALEKS